MYETSLYCDSPNGNGYIRVYLSKDGNTELGHTHTIDSTVSGEDIWNTTRRTGVAQLATGTYGMYKYNNSGTFSLNGGTTGSFVSLTWLGV